MLVVDRDPAVTRGIFADKEGSEIPVAGRVADDKMVASAYGDHSQYRKIGDRVRVDDRVPGSTIFNTGGGCDGLRSFEATDEGRLVTHVRPSSEIIEPGVVEGVESCDKPIPTVWGKFLTFDEFVE